jgi:ribosomal-protein-alanine N-acetyltransferase
MMSDEIEIRAAGLILRPLMLTDDLELSRIATREVSDAMVSVPHPMSVSVARGWIEQELECAQRETALAFGVRRDGEPSLLGVTALRHIDREHACGELSFWLAASARGQGTCTTSAAVVLEYGFSELGLHRIEAYQMLRNVPSGRVLSRLRFRAEGVLRSRVVKWGEPQDVRLWSRLRSD